MGKLIDIENIDYVRLEDSLHCLEHHKGDEVECVICAPTVEAIPKDQYENRLKADMVAMLEELQLEIEEVARCPYTECIGGDCPFQDCMIHKGRVVSLIQSKINSLKEK